MSYFDSKKKAHRERETESNYNERVDSTFILSIINFYSSVVEISAHDNRMKSVGSKPARKPRQMNPFLPIKVT